MLTAIIKVVSQILAGIPPGAIARCIALVQEANDKTELSGTEKFQWVFNKMMEEYSLSTSDTNTLIEIIESFVRRGLGI